MNNGLNSFASDVAAEENGIWMTVNGMGFKIARVGNDKWKSTYKTLEKAAYGSHARKKDKRDSEKDVSLMLECLARTCVLDWRDVTLDGKQVKYTTEKSVEILTNKRFHKLAEYLLDLAMDEEYFMESEIADDEEKAKN